MLAPREHWGSRVGVILAAAGSAVGLGNIWKFPYLAGQHGGAAFLITYLALAFTIGISVMLCEFIIGRAARKDPIGAFAKLKGGLWPIVGFMGIAAAFAILSYYSVVGGWTLAYILKMMTGVLVNGTSQELGKVFSNFIENPVRPIIFHAAFMTLTIAVVIGGIGRGIERWCKILLPALFVIILILLGRSLTLPGAMKGIEYFLQPDFSKMNAAAFNAALSQAFFSLSIGMGAMITYGSYLDRTMNLPTSTIWTTSLDTSIAFLAGLVILPAVFAFGFDPNAGPGLTFITLPAVFANMPGGVVFAPLFFVLLAIAALTSAVSLLEVVVTYLVDEKGVSRRTAAWGSGAVMFLIGIPASLSLGVWKDYTIFGKGIFDFLDYLSSNLLLPLGGIFIALFVGWFFSEKALEEATAGGKHRFPVARIWMFICKFIAPLAIAWILISGL
ncbi:MAG: sodium-dependent transporter [Rhodospirillaceae bacterium]